AAHDRRLRAAHVQAVEAQELDYRFRRRWDEVGMPGRKQAGVLRVNALDVLLRRDLLDRVPFVERSRQRCQQQDPVHVEVGGQGTQARIEVRGARAAGKRIDADVDAQML